MKKVKLNKDFQGREVEMAIVNISQNKVDLSAGHYTIYDENGVGKFLLEPNSCKMYFVPNQEFDKAARRVRVY